MRKLLATAAVLIVVAVAGYYGYTKYQSNALIESTTPHIKEATLRTKSVIELLTAPANVTFGEIFEKGGETVKKIADTLIAVESQTSKGNPEAVQSATKYLKANQEITRTILSTTRARFDARNAADTMDEALADLRRSSGYARTYANERLTRAIERTEKALEKSKIEITGAQASIESLKNAHASASEFFPPDALLPSSAIAALESHYSPSDPAPK